MEVIKAGADAHGVMPGDGECPPHQSAKNALPNCKNQDVPFFGEDPSHQSSANSGERHEHRVGPMEESKEQTGNKRCVRDALRCGEQTVVHHRIQSHLLNQAETHVAEEMPGKENRIHRTMPAAEDQANCYNRENAREKNY